MRAKRLNVKLAIFLSLALVAVVAGVSYLHGYQVRRTAREMLDGAQECQAKGERTEALRLYRHYVNCVPDDHEAFSRYALLVSEEAEETPGDRQMQMKAYFTLEQAARRDPDNLDVLGKLVDASLQVGRTTDAMKILPRLLKAFPKDASLERKLALCQVATEHYPEAVAALKSAIQLDPTNVASYFELAGLYRARLNDPEAAEVTLKQLVEANPKSPKAYLIRSDYWLRDRKPEEAKKDLQRAAELAPDDLNVLLASAAFASAMNQLDEADRQLKRAKELFPNNQQVLRAAVDLRLRRRQPQEAMNLLEEAVAREPKAAMEQVRLVELQLDTGNVEGARVHLKQLHETDCSPLLLEYLDSRLLMADGKWLAASNRLEKVRSQVASDPRWAVKTDLALGACYERLGLPDLQLQAYQRALSQEPSHLVARIGHASALFRSGKADRALEEFRRLRQTMGDKAFFKVPQLPLSLYQLLLSAARRQPKEQRDWSEIDQLVESLSGAEGVDQVQVALMRAGVLVAQGRTKDAYDLIAAKCKEEPKQPRWWVELATLAARAEGPEKSLEVLDQATKQLGNLLLFRLARADRVSRMDRDKAEPVLQKLAEQAGDLPAKDRAAMLEALAVAYYRLQDRQKAQDFWRQAADAQPDNAPLRLTLFEVSRELGDEKGMEEACQEIKRLLGSHSAEWGYAEAARRVYQARSDKNAAQLLKEATELLGQARELRPAWSAPVRLEAEIALREGRLDDAIAAFKQARELGPLQPVHFTQFVQLLYGRQRYEEARQALADMDVADLVPELRRIRAELEMQSGDADAAIETAKSAVAGSKQASDFVWQGQLLLRAKHHDEAAAAFRRAIELDPQSSKARLLLILSLSAAGKKDEADAQLKQMRGSLSAEELPLALAQAYQLLGQQAEAEREYQAAVAAKPNDPDLLLRVAAFHAQTAQGDHSRVEKVAEELKHIVELASRDPKKNARQLAAARRMLAEMLASSGDWRQRREALELLGEGEDGSKPATLDLHIKAGVLAASPSRAEQAEAIALLEQLQKDGSGLSAEEQLRLASLYEANGQWQTCRRTLLDLLATKPDVPYVIALLQVLFRHEAPAQEISPWVDKLASLRPDNPVTTIMQARLLAARGETAQAVAKLEAALPRPLPDEQLTRLGNTALVLEDLKQYDKAKKLLEEYAERKPEGKLALAQFLARRNEIERALDVCESARKDCPAVEVVSAALNVLRQEARQGQIVAEHAARVDQWLKEVLAEKAPTKKAQLERDLLLTTLREMQGHRDELIRIYTGLLEREDLTDMDRAPIWNNLAFVLASDKQDGAKALELANRAVAVLGPAPEVLDTRAVAYLASGKPTEAIKDLREAIGGSPSGLKYFHLALAQAAASDRSGAAKSWKTAHGEFGLTAAQIPPLERKSYEKLATSLADLLKDRSGS